MRVYPARPFIDERETAWTTSTPAAVGLINGGVHEGAILTGRDAQRGGHCHRDQRGIGEGREIDEVHAIGEGWNHIVGRGESKSRLADPTGTDQGHQRDSVVQYEGARRRPLVLPDDEQGAAEAAVRTMSAVIDAMGDMGGGSEP